VSGACLFDPASGILFAALGVLDGQHYPLFRIMIAAASVFALILPVLMNAPAFKNGPVAHGSHAVSAEAMPAPYRAD